MCTDNGPFKICVFNYYSIIAIQPNKWEVCRCADKYLFIQL